MFSMLTTAVALEAIWQIYCSGWSTKIPSVLEANGTRERWLNQFGDEIASALEALDAATW